MDSINESIARALEVDRPSRGHALPSAKDCMATHLIAFDGKQTLAEVMALLLKHRISGGPVLEENRHLAGMISEMDCLRAIASGAYDAEPFQADRLVEDVMTRDCITVPPTADMYTMTQLFDRHKVRRLPVVDDDVVVGQVSRRDILRKILEQ